jgi:nucleoside phosphorylase
MGTVASGEAVIQDGELRDRLSRDCSNARCFEMEAVGVNLNSRCLVIRGIADYADSHKNDVWKYTAAGNAAAFAKEFLLTMNAGGLKELSGIVADRSELA